MEEGLTKVYDILSNIEERTKNHSKLLEDVPDIKTTLKKLVDTQDSLAQSNNRIAATFEVLTETQKMLQSQNKDLQATNKDNNEVIAGNDRVPLKTHYMSMGLAALPGCLIAIIMVLYVLYVTGSEVDVSASRLKINRVIETSQKKIEEKIDESHEQTKKEVESKIDEKAKEIINSK